MKADGLRPPESKMRYDNASKGEDYYYGAIDYTQGMCIVGILISGQLAQTCKILGQHPFERAKRSTDYIRSVDTDDKWGVEAKEHEYPWLVLIQNGCDWEKKGKMHICGGSLISTTLVLSSDHCIKCDLKGRNDVSYALFGVHKWSGKFVEKTGSQKHAHDIIPIIKEVHPETKEQNDISILVLERPVKLSNRVCPILLPFRDESVVKQDAVVAGWGRRINDAAAELSVVLRKCDTHVKRITADLYDNSENNCWAVINARRCYLFRVKGLPCDACLGDSGNLPPILIALRKCSRGATDDKKEWWILFVRDCFSGIWEM